MSIDGDTFYQRLKEINYTALARRRRRQLAADIQDGKLKPTAKNFRFLFDRIGCLEETRDEDRAILKAVLQLPAFPDEVRDYSPDICCANAFVHLEMATELWTLVEKHNLNYFWNEFVAQCRHYVLFHLDNNQPSLLDMPFAQMYGAGVYEPKNIGEIDQDVAAWMLQCYNRQPTHVRYAPYNSSKSWWRLLRGKQSASFSTDCMLMALAAYVYPKGKWPLDSLPLSGQNLLGFVAGYREKLAYLERLVSALDSTGHLPNEALQRLSTKHAYFFPQPFCQYLRGVEPAEDFVLLASFKDRMVQDCNRVFARVWADACDTIVAIQQSALGVCGKALPHYVVLDLLRLTQDGITTLVVDEERLIALIEERTKRAEAVRDAALARLEEEAVIANIQHHYFLERAIATATNKRKFAAVSN